MSFLLKTAGKNILRNTRRTILSGITICLASIVICTIMAFQNGMIDDMKNNIINHVTGTIRIRAKQYSENERILPVQFYIPQTKELCESIKKVAHVIEVSPQIKIPVTMHRTIKETDEDEIIPITVVGIDFNNNHFFNDKNTQIVEGNIPQQNNSNKTNLNKHVVISEGLSQRTGLKSLSNKENSNNKFTFITKTSSGGSNGVTVFVDSIAYIADTDFNASHFFMDWQTLSDVMRMGGNALEILVFVDNKINTTTINNTIIKEIKNIIDSYNFDFELEVLEWTQTSVIYQFIKMADTMYTFMSVFFFVLASTVIFNTTMMSILERKKEIGTLISLGMESKNISQLFLLETIIISLCSALIGVFIGFICVSIMNKIGFDLNTLGGNAVSGFNFSSYIYPSLPIKKYIQIVIMGTLISSFACMFPISMVYKVEPAEALRTEN